MKTHTHTHTKLCSAVFVHIGVVPGSKAKHPSVYCHTWLEPQTTTCNKLSFIQADMSVHNNTHPHTITLSFVAMMR